MDTPTLTELRRSDRDRLAAFAETLNCSLLALRQR